MVFRSYLLRLVRVIGLLALASITPACGGKASPANSPDAAARAIAAADTRLRGTWVLQSFTPDTPLEPMLKAMLDFQFGRLLVRFDGKRMVADSIGIHVDRAYRIIEVKGDQFLITTFDEHGVPYDASCTFLSGDRIEIHGRTEPWRGLAYIARVLVAIGPAATPPPGSPAVVEPR